MKKISVNSKRGKQWKEAYLKSKYNSIYDLYRNPSNEKRYVESALIKIMHEEGGWNYKVLGGNSMMFTCGWLMNNGNLRIETRYNSYEIVYDYEK